METPPDVTEDKRKLSRVARLIVREALGHGFSEDAVLFAKEHGLPVGEADTYRTFLMEEWGLEVIPDDGSEEAASEAASQHMAEVA